MANMNKIVLGVWLTFQLLTACNSAEEENTVTSGESPVAPAAVANSISDSPKPVTATQAAPQVPANPVVVNTPPPVPIAGASPKVNPAHGLPGHRCDLQVGAPLPQAGTAPAAQVMPTAPAGPQAGPAVQSIALPPPPLNTGVPVSGSKKVNPAHGQPGHRCDIAVGAPLN